MCIAFIVVLPLSLLPPTLPHSSPLPSSFPPTLPLSLSLSLSPYLLAGRSGNDVYSLAFMGRVSGLEGTVPEPGGCTASQMLPIAPLIQPCPSLLGMLLVAVRTLSGRWHGIQRTVLRSPACWCVPQLTHRTASMQST